MSSKKKKNTKESSPSANHSTFPAASGEGRCPFAIEEARRRFPSFVSPSSFPASVCEIEPQTRWPGAAIWLSESAMMSSKLRSSSLVTVSLVRSGEDTIDDLPIESLPMACADRFSLTGAVGGDDPGNYFAMATVFTSAKVAKGGARISWNLSCTIGNPSIGRILLVSPVEICSSETKASDPPDLEIPRISLFKCSDLHLKVVPYKNKETVLPVSVEPQHLENPTMSSPKTPSTHRSRVSAFGSPKSRDSSSSRGKEHQPLVTNQHEFPMSSDDSFISKALTDEKMKEILHLLSRRWLISRTLLPGNLISIPMLGRLYFFRVEASSAFSFEKYSGHFENKVKSTTALLIDSDTTTHLFLSPPVVSDKIDAPRLVENDDLDEVNHDIIPRLGGLSKEFEMIQEIINFSLIKRDHLSRMGLRPTKGILLHGPPGTGKTSLACASARHAGVNLVCINGPEIVSQYYGESEQSLAAIFDSAKKSSPSLVFIDELDAIAPARTDAGEELSQRIVAALLNLMDGAIQNEGVLVIAATNRPDSIDQALRRPRRLDTEIEIGVPSSGQRVEILHTILKQMKHSLVDADIASLASSTHGFVGADIAALCNEAALAALRRYSKFRTASSAPLSSEKATKHPLDTSIDDTYSQISSCKTAATPGKVDHISFSLSNLSISSNSPNDDAKGCTVSNEVAENALYTHREAEQEVRSSSIVGESDLSITIHDFAKARMKVRPSAMREVLLEVPKVSWSDIGGQKEIKQQLMEAVIWPQKHRAAFDSIGTRPPTGVLLYGPPGCSKTLLARAVASEAQLNFLAVKGPELFSKWVGESEKAVKSLFSKARAAAPSIIFFDEIDGLAIVRGQDNDADSVGNRVMSQLLVEMDGLHQRTGVVIIAATNRPDKIDSALLRPGRFDRLVYVEPPNEKAREEIFQINMRKMPCSSDVSITELANLTEGYTGADISMICREAALAALEGNLDASSISKANFKAAIQRVPPSKTESYLGLSRKFERFISSSMFDEGSN